MQPARLERNLNLPGDLDGWKVMRQSPPNNSLDRSGGSVFRIKPGAAKDD
jgi:hypothetical protein